LLRFDGSAMRRVGEQSDKAASYPAICVKPENGFVAPPMCFAAKARRNKRIDVSASPRLCD
jgi:hypothetical protein